MKTAKNLLIMLLVMCMTLAFATACNGDEETPVTPPGNDTPVIANEDNEDDENEEPEEPEEDTSGWIDIGAPFKINPDRIIYSNNFDEEVGLFLPRGSVKLELTPDARDGKALSVTGRTLAWNGATINVGKLLFEEFNNNVFRYEVLAWVKAVPGTESGRINLSYQLRHLRDIPCSDAHPGSNDCNRYDYFMDFDSGENKQSKYTIPFVQKDEFDDDYLTNYPDGYTTGDGWVLIHGIFVMPVDVETMQPTVGEIHFYFENSAVTADFLIDDFYILRI